MWVGLRGGWPQQQEGQKASLLCGGAPGVDTTMDTNTHWAAVESPAGPRKQEPSWEAAALHWARLSAPALHPWGSDAAGLRRAGSG